MLTTTGRKPERGNEIQPEVRGQKQNRNSARVLGSESLAHPTQQSVPAALQLLQAFHVYLPASVSTEEGENPAL